MSTVEQIVSLFTKFLTWQVVVLLVALVFRRQIMGLVSRLGEVKFGERAIRFGEEKTVSLSPTPPNAQLAAGSRDRTSNLPAFLTEKTANIYWLGHDLMFAIDVLLRMGPKKDIVFGLKQSLHHATQIGLKGTTYHKLLDQVLGKALEVSTGEWDPKKRLEVATDLKEIKDGFGSLFSSSQPDFLPWAEN